jgi:starch-binding outer membrane protein, SusD/RagB family
MKKLICYLLLMGSLVSCNDGFLDKVPKDKLSEQSIWSDIALAETYTNNLYLGVSNGFARGCAMLSAISDEANGRYTWTQVERVNLGDYSASNAPVFSESWDPNSNGLALWYSQFDYIRRCNVLLSKIDNVPGDVADKDKLKGEGYFFRALYYHELTKFYGGVPIIDKVTILDDISALAVPRNTYDECVNFMVSDLDNAAGLLPDEKFSSRVVKASAMALKARVLLYAKRWNESAAASQEVMNNTKFSLHPAYGSLFTNAGRGSNEILFSKQFAKGLLVHPVDQYNYPISTGGWGFTNPTQDFVDMYEMSDGKDYRSSSLYTPTEPYKNRDPRFYASIIYDGSQFAGKTINTRAGSGNDGILGGGGGGENTTGYYMRKFLNEDAKDELYSLGSFGASYNDWIILRLGEVLLNYAEAQNEASGPDGTVYAAVNRVRTRAGLPDLDPGLSQDQMREKIRHERAIELAFEEHRYFDVIRWGLGPTVFNQPIHGMSINSTGDTFTRFVVEPRVFQPRHNLFPIPEAEIQKNKNLLPNNPGW